MQGQVWCLWGCITGELVLSCFLSQWVLLYKLVLVCKIGVYFLIFNRDTLVTHCFSEVSSRWLNLAVLLALLPSLSQLYELLMSSMS